MPNEALSTDDETAGIARASLGARLSSGPTQGKDYPVPDSKDPSNSLGTSHDLGTHFRVWAPLARKVDVHLFPPDGSVSIVGLDSVNDGFFEGFAPGFTAGALYKYSLDGNEAYPDPVSRFQPQGPHGPSEVIDTGFAWSEAEARWPGLSIDGQVLYELHIGTFTAEGTFRSAIAEFPRLRQFGITVLEIMPVAEFAGDIGWGYDGVALFAPFHRYGRPEDLCAMIDAAHACGLGVILDVVYNHLGPDGNYLEKYSADYFRDNHTEWGRAINFDGKNSEFVREFFLANVALWIGAYHFDGLRLDATQAIHDDGRRGTHILREIADCVRAAAGGKKTIVVAENEPQETRLIDGVEDGGYGLDAIWNDDFHHSAIVALTGRREAYYSDHLGLPQEFISSAKYGFLFQGQYYSWQKQRRGTASLNFDSRSFITFLENHDQVANYGRSLRMRMLASPAKYRAMTALWLLSPGTPLFFQGQEYGATGPFFFFAGHSGELGEMVNKGRAEFMLQFGSQDTEEMKECFVDPLQASTFERSRLRHEEQSRYPELGRLQRDLLALRKNDRVLSRRVPSRVDGAVLGEHAFLLRYITDHGEDRLLVVNLGTGLDLPHTPEPLLAPPRGCQWKMTFHTEKCGYGGNGASPPERFGAWQLQGECAQLLVAERARHPDEPEPEKTGSE